MASMVAAVNSVLAGAGVALLVLVTLSGGAIAIAVILGIAAAAGLMAVFYWYRDHRYGAFKPTAPRPGQAVRPESSLPGA